ncbi:MAG TPA: Gfo/Idh/MocA family oxidoreductase [Planctomycetota bacterium]|jgi:predicted dehydrogenase
MLSRRGFLKAGAAAAGVAVAAPYVMADTSAGGKLNVAVIGGGGMGGYSKDQAMKENFVAVADVDEGNIAKVMADCKKAGKPEPKVFYDYRKMLDECNKDIDVVLIATPDHNHAPAAIRAINLGKHCFNQKPMAQNIYECYALAKAAKEKKVLTQMGNQRHCGDPIRRLCERVWAGAVGQITESHTILGRNFGGSGGRPPTKPVPKGLHWDEWIGPAPYREFHDGLHPFSWRDYRAFGTGTVGDMACHHLDFPFMALKIGEVKKFTVECLNTKNGSEEKYAQDNIVCWSMPARGDMAPVKIYAYDHEKLQNDMMKERAKEFARNWNESTLFVGEKGLIGSDSRLIPQQKDKEYQAPPKTLPPAKGGPIEDLFACIKTGGTPCANFVDYAGPMAAFILTGLLAQNAGVGKKVEWDVEKMQCTNIPELNQYVKREYRKGWEV